VLTDLKAKIRVNKIFKERNPILKKNMNQNKIHDLLISQGYERILEEFSGGDGWYINSHTSTRLATQKFH
jgi:hypothetical protein